MASKSDGTPEREAAIPELPTRASNPPAVPPDTGPEPVIHDTSFEVALDDKPEPTAAPTHVDVPDIRHTHRPVIPEHLRSRAGLATTTKQAVTRTVYRTAYHTLRSPRYLLLALWWGIWGVFKTIYVQLRWWWLVESAPLRQDATDRNDHAMWLKLHKEAKATHLNRGRWLIVELLGVAGGVWALVALAPWWASVLVLAVALPLLAHFGRPADKPIVSAAVVTARHRRLNADIVLRAYYAAGLGHPEKPGMQITFGSTMSRDALNTGSQVLVDLPYGTTFSDAMKAREKLASGLDVALSQVYLARDKSSNRRHLLYVADVDPLSIPAGRTPLLDCRPRDIWRPAPLGLDERGRRVLLDLVFYSVLIGAQPRKGKSFTGRALALFAALDPHVRLSVFDGAGKPDWKMFALVAHTYGFGLLANPIQGDPVENLRATLRAAKREVQERNAKLAELPTSVCPEGKLTRDIARNKKYKMPIWMLVLDEFQEYLNTGDEEADREIAELLVFLVRVAPSVGVILISLTQKPSGLGSTGKIQKLFTDFRDNHLTRFSLKTASYLVSEVVLGAGAYSEGFDSSILPVGDEYRGIGILYDAPVDNCTVRCYLADGEDAEKILVAARALRERAGTLDGMAAGDAVVVQARDPLTDVYDAFGPDETWVSWNRLAERLAEQLPERYAKVTPAGLSNTVTGLKLGIESRSGRCESVPGGVTKGVHRAALERAIERRSREAEQT
ncbi:MAG: hypothetical protein ACRDTZ_00030 [Pseudonocardiaceae bacterium]